MNDQPSQIFIASSDEVHCVRPPKRKRGLDEDNLTERVRGDRPALYSAQNYPNPVPDKEWYLSQPDDIVVVQVQSVLFKVKESVFGLCQDMTYDLVQHRVTKGSTTRDSPLFIPWITAEQFRLLVWLSYSTSASLHISWLQHSTQAIIRIFSEASRKKPIQEQDEDYVPRLVKLNNFAGKFTDGVSIQEFIYEYMQTTTPTKENTNFLLECSSIILAAQVEYFSTVGNQTARDQVVEIWIRRLRSEPVAFVPAIITARKCDIDRLLGIACFFYLREIAGKAADPSNPHSAIHLPIDDKLSAEHVPVLLQGYFSLSNLSHQLRHNPISLPMGDSCCLSRHEKCVAVWKDRWVAVSRYLRITKLPPAEVVYLIRDMRDALNNDEEVKNGLTSDCRLAGLRKMQKLMESLEDPQTLGHHFSVKKTSAYT